MDRRQFLTVLAAGTATALGVTAPVASAQPGPTIRLPGLPPLSLPPLPGVPQAVPGERPSPAGLLPPDVKSRRPLPPNPIKALLGPGRHMALTIDDGADSAVVESYIRFAEDTGARFTFFVTGSYPSWTDHRVRLRRLVDSGQIQLGNHTWTHPNLTRVPESVIVDELQKTKRFLRNTFGVDGSPYYRPPYGRRTNRVDAVAADVGYPASTVWYGTLEDSRVITEKILIENARKYFRPQSVVIGHANRRPVTHVYDELVEIIRDRKLRLVTLDDYFLPFR